MSWLLENWFGSKESLDQVREDIHQNLQKESYLGVSGIEHPEASQNRLSSRELRLALTSPWAKQLQEFETELLQFVHEELPPVVRDEVGILPFFTNVVDEGFLVLAFVRNATNREILLNKLPMTLVTPDGEVVAAKTFDLLPNGPIGSFTSRPFEFLFRWEEFQRLPEEQVQLTMVYNRAKKKRDNAALAEKNGLTPEEQAQYAVLAEEKRATAGQVSLQVLGIKAMDEGGMKVIVLFQNGLDKRLEFTEVPILVRDKEGDLVARVRYGLKNLHVEPGESRLWGFYVPEDMMKKGNVNPIECTAYIPEPQPEEGESWNGSSTGLVQ